MTYWRKGDKAPDLGVANRHTRDKALLILGFATEDQLRQALILLISNRPELALDALCEATDPDKDRP